MSRKKLRSTIAKLNPPQLRPILLHFFAHLDQTIEAQLQPILEKNALLNQSHQILLDRITALESEQSTLRELNTIQDARQRKTEQDCKNCLRQLQKLTDDQQRNTQNNDKKMQSVTESVKDNARDHQDTLHREMLLLNSKIQKIEIEIAKQGCQQKSALAAPHPPAPTAPHPPP